MTKEKRVLEYLQEHGSISSMEAFEKLRETRLSAKIFMLRCKGYEIYTMSEGVVIDGRRQICARYYLRYR